MKRAIRWWMAAALAATALTGCGGGGGGDVAPIAPTPPPAVNVGPAIAAAAGAPANDTATNQTAPFTVLQAAGLPAAQLSNGVLKVNFSVFSDGAVKSGLTLSNVSVAIARLVPASNGNAATWVNYVSRTATATAGLGPGGAQVPPATVQQATTDPKPGTAQLAYDAQGFYTYTFTANITDPAWNQTVSGVRYSSNGAAFLPAATHRVALQLSYTNAAGQTVRVNPYFDFTFNGSGATFASAVLTNPATQSSQISDVSSCNGCHEKLALHGGGMVATQYCVMCHNPGTTDPESLNVLTFSTMAHKIHAGRGLAAAPGGEAYTIWGFRNTKYDYSDVGYPQDLRNCSVCHTASAATPQGDNWKSRATQQACITCHAAGQAGSWWTSHLPFAFSLIGPAAKPTDLTNAQCTACHTAGTNLGADVVHFPQEQANQALYRMAIDSVAFNDTSDHRGRTVTVKYTLTDPTNGNAPYRLLVNAADCTVANNVTTNCSNARFGNLRAYLAFQSMPGQLPSATEFSSYNNGGSGAYACLYEGPTSTACPRVATHEGGNKYSVTIPVPDDTGNLVVSGTAMVTTVGQIKEPELRAQWATPPRPPVTPTVLLNTAVQHTSAQLALTGTLQPRRQIVSDAKCNVCHGVLGTAGGSNTVSNAFHSGARNTWQSCTLCHDPNRVSSSVMTDGRQLNLSMQFKTMIHGIHGNTKRFFPFAHGNTVVWPFCNPQNTSAAAQAACDPSRTLAASVTNFAAETFWPGSSLNCNACHVNDSWKRDAGTLGAVVLKNGTSAAGPVVFGGTVGVTNPWAWNAITPKAASCLSCHDSPTAVQHVGFFGAVYGTATQAVGMSQPETCNDCHAPGSGPKAVDLVHGLK